MIVRTYSPDDLPLLQRFIAGYRADYPDAKLADAELYTYHPAVANGQHAFCAIDDVGDIGTAGMVGFAPIFVALDDNVDRAVPQQLWLIVLAQRGHKATQQIYESLFTAVLQRAHEIKAQIAPRSLVLAADMMLSQHDDIAAFAQRGFKPFARVFVMQRTLNELIPDVSIPSELSIGLSRLSSSDEQAEYLTACNTCFAEQPRNAEGLQFLLNSPGWTHGCAIIARTVQHEIAGSVLVYINGNLGTGQAVGIVDDVFVVPQWRGRGLAKALIGRGLQYLRERHMDLSLLEVDASNAPALATYYAMGYRVVNEEQLLRLPV